MTGCHLVESRFGARPSCLPHFAVAQPTMPAGMNPMDLKCGVDMAVNAVVKDVEKRSKKVSTNDEIAQVGTACSRSTDPRSRRAERTALADRC